jgi:hypothetical protein
MCLWLIYVCDAATCELAAARSNGADKTDEMIHSFIFHHVVHMILNWEISPDE